MEIKRNDTLIQRNKRLGNILSIGSIGIMAVGVVISFQNREMFAIPMTLVIIGMLLSQIGVSLRNRWALQPRVDQLFDQALKGFGSDYQLFHYSLGADHVLHGPSGMVVLVPIPDPGQLSFKDGKWYHTPKRRLIGKPKARKIDIEGLVEREQTRLRKYLTERLPSAEKMPQISPLIVALHPDSDVDSRQAPHPTTYVKKIKTDIRKLPKGGSLDSQTIQSLNL